MSDTFVITVLVTIAVCGAVGGLLLQDSGRQGMGAALGALLGPIGVIIAAILRLKRTYAAPIPSGLKKCPECAELIQPDARRCRYCGADVSAVVAPTLASTPAEPSPPFVWTPVKRVGTVVLVLLCVFMFVAAFLRRSSS